MPRLDIRLKTNLTAIAIHGAGPDRIEERVRCKELSLSGGLLSGLTAEPQKTFTLSITFPQSRIELAAEQIKRCQNSSVVRFFFPKRQALSSLWSYLKGQAIVQGTCPYCGKALVRASDACGNCGQCLLFTDKSYLDRHLLETLNERILGRLAKLDPSFLQRVIALMDSNIMGLSQEASEDEFVGTAPAILEVFSMIRRAAATDMNILILGESGTGKELTVQAIHEKSLRKDKPLIVVNCAAIPEGLLEAELFGYEKGAFTGAVATKKGRFELAEGGTIFLDEIGDLPSGLQAKLLRFLEDLTVERVGGKTGKRVDVRIIAATNCDLAAMVERQSFRKDLLFRLNSFTIKLPPLRERGEDKVILAKYFFNKFGRAEQTNLTGFSEAALKAIRAYDWPGNVRELVNKVRRAIVMAMGECIEPVDMELGHLVQYPQFTKADDSRERVFTALCQNGYVVSRAAKALMVSRPTMYSLIRKYEIAVPFKHH
jgi:transcriptional regulator with GAF, ATPase, and Fis domain